MPGCQKIDSLEKEENISRNRSEYADRYDELHWIDEKKAEEVLAKRDRIMEELTNRGVLFSHGGSKLDVRRLSPGCRACGSGDWSCLFINGICNMRCFYCPSDQGAEEVPQTNTVPFPDPRDYIDYLKYFNFTGVSMSGGEPLMTYKKTLRYIDMVRRHIGDRVHIWMYTNGTLASGDRLSALRDAGLNEIRFDIGALGYRLEPIFQAIGLFDVVSVEIPAIPEDFSLLCDTVLRLKEAGVGYLNLHQLQLTPYNFSKLCKRNYTFLHGPKVTVLESELTALKLLLWTLEKGVDLPVNYCSFIYKHTYQKAAARRKGAEHIKKSHEDLTNTGLIRSLSVEASADYLGECVTHLAGIPDMKGLWFYEKGRGRLYFRAVLWKYIDFSKIGKLFVKYDVTAIMPELSYGYVFKTVELNKRKKIHIERRPLGPETVLSGDEIEYFKNSFLDADAGDAGSTQKSFPLSDGLTVIKRLEVYPEGLADYY